MPVYEYENKISHINAGLSDKEIRIKLNPKFNMYPEC